MTGVILCHICGRPVKVGDDGRIAQHIRYDPRDESREQATLYYCQGSGVDPGDGCECDICGSKEKVTSCADSIYRCPSCKRRSTELDDPILDEW